MVAFLQLLNKWNKVYNLSAIREIDKMVELHILDSLSVLPYLEGKRIIDIGTGAGLPGIPLALASPDQQFVLLDSNGKKTRFIQQAVIELGVENIEVVTSRIEEFHPEQMFDTIISRAFASLSDMLVGSAHLMKRETLMLAMKGRLNEEELGELPPVLRVENIVSLNVPGINADRHLICARLAQ